MCVCVCACVYVYQGLCAHVHVSRDQASTRRRLRGVAVVLFATDGGFGCASDFSTSARVIERLAVSYVQCP